MKKFCQTVSNGTQHDVAAAVTPGRAWMLWTPSRTSLSISEVFSNRVPASDICMINTLWESKPGLTACSWMDERISSAALTSRTKARAISPITSSERVLLCRRPVPDRPALSLRVVMRSIREAGSAGMRPNNTPVIKEIRNVNVRTRQSSVIAEPYSPIRGILTILSGARRGLLG